MTHAEAVAAIPYVEGVTQEIVDALEDGLNAVERERDNLRWELERAEGQLRFAEGELNVARGRIEGYETHLATQRDDLPF